MWPNSIILHVFVQFSQHNLLNRLSVSYCMFLLCCQISFWVLYSVPLIYISVLCFRIHYVTVMKLYCHKSFQNAKPNNALYPINGLQMDNIEPMTVIF